MVPPENATALEPRAATPSSHSGEAPSKHASQPKIVNGTMTAGFPPVAAPPPGAPTRRHRLRPIVDRWSQVYNRDGPMAATPAAWSGTSPSRSADLLRLGRS